MSKEPKKKAESEPKKPTDADKVVELTDDLQRLQAEFENYKKRLDKEQAAVSVHAKADMVAQLLPVLDSFDAALKQSPDNEGVQLLYTQLMDVLSKAGLGPIESLGKQHDPFLHEVLLKEPSDKEDGVVLEELQKGYLFGDKVLRHTKVKVAEKKAEQAPKED